MFRLCLVTAMGDKPLNDKPLDDYLNFLRAVVRGGVDCVEWREKHQPMEKLTALRAIKKLLDELSVPLLINDYPAICAMVDASGVHLGNSDMTAAAARAIIGKEKTIGKSIESMNDMDSANQQDNINYVTVSAVFASQNKTDTKKIWGIDGLADVVKISQKPITAIGGITLENVAAVMATGVYGVAVVGALHDATNPFVAAKNFRDIIDRSNK